MNQCLIITGMHRSGTSYAASLLQEAGLSIGQQLLGATTGNNLGHFENIDFLDFHRQVLAANELHPDGWDLRCVNSFSQETKDQAAALIVRHQRPQWGWKDPRTVLFLNAWQTLLPKAKYLLVYRAPWEVVDSLYRRGTDAVFNANPKHAINVWKYYNERVLSFYQAHQNHALLVNIRDLILQPTTVLTMLHDRLGCMLRRTTGALFNHQLFHHQSLKGVDLECLIQYHSPEAYTLYYALEKANILPPSPSAQKTTPHENLSTSIYRLWQQAQTQPSMCGPHDSLPQRTE